MGPALSRHHRHERALELRGIDFSQAQKRPIRRSAAVFEHLVSRRRLHPAKVPGRTLGGFLSTFKVAKNCGRTTLRKRTGGSAHRERNPLHQQQPDSGGLVLELSSALMGINLRLPPITRLPDYSNSMVPQGFGVRSYRTRQMPSTSEAMRSPIFLRSAQSSSGTSAVIASTVLTARMNAGHS